MKMYLSLLRNHLRILSSSLRKAPTTFMTRNPVRSLHHMTNTPFRPMINQKFLQRLSHQDSTVDGGAVEIGKVETKMNLMYKCKVCDTHNSHIISKLAYEKGVVIVTCEGCKNKHLIADNLNWFQDIKEKNIEEMLAKKGEIVFKVKSVQCNENE
ncbi:hypothetical protein B566_EDAN003010 [Ephemera danica]|nr:hypothetical protein B566_EDAN003010 [Ephemera danica]